MKRIVYSVLIVILLVLGIIVGVFFEEKEEVIEKPPVVDKNDVSIMEFGRYKNIKVENIDYIEKIRYTEGGDNTEIFKDTYKINSTYNYLNSRKVGSRTEMACEDNTTIYKFYMKDGTNYSIEIECGILVMGKNRYTLK